MMGKKDYLPDRKSGVIVRKLTEIVIKQTGKHSDLKLPQKLIL